MQKRCKYCGEIFIVKNSKRKYCSDDCKKAAVLRRNRIKTDIKKQSANKIKKKPTYSINDICAEQERYKKQTGKYLTYGQTVARLEHQI